MGTFLGGVMLDRRTYRSRAVAGVTLVAVDVATDEVLPTLSLVDQATPSPVTTNGDGAYSDFFIADRDIARLTSGGVSQVVVSAEVLAGQARSLAQPVATSADLPTVERDGSLRVTEDDLHLWVWDDALPGWTDLGSLRGEDGLGASDADIAAHVSTEGTETRTAVEQVADAAVAPIAPTNGNRAVGQDELVLDAATRGLPTNGTTDASPAISQTLADARAQARVASTRAQGAPPVYIPGGVYKVSTSILLELILGQTVRGAGMGRTILYVDAGIDLFRLHRAGSIRIQDMSLVCSRGGATPALHPSTDALVEGSCGVHITERSDDPVLGISNTDIAFENVSFTGFHRSVRATGNQMGDNVTFLNCKWVDNFYDFDLENGQSVNWRVLGGEVLGFVAAAESTYDTLLAGWSAASKPVTAPGASPTTRDGAVVRAKSGGNLTFVGTSFIANKTRLLLAGLPTDGTAADTYGSVQNALPYVFEGCSGEIRGTKDSGDSWGYDRKSLVRYETPHPPSNADNTQSQTVIFSGERISVTVLAHAAWTALHLTNRVAVHWLQSRAKGGDGVYELVSCLTSVHTESAPGHFSAKDSTILTRRRVGRTTAGGAWTPLRGIEHDIVQDGRSASTSLAAPAIGYDRTLTNARPRQRMVVALHLVDGTIPRDGVNARRVVLPANAMVLRVSVVAFNNPGSTATMEFRRSTGTAFASLVVSANAGTESVVSGGKRLTDCRAPWHEVNIEVADGVIDVLQVGTPAVMSGHVLIEYV